MNTTVTEDSRTGRSQTRTVERNTERLLWCHTELQGGEHWASWSWRDPVCLVDTHSDPEESPSTVPALILMATPFSWSGRTDLAGPARLTLDEDPCGDTVPGTFPPGSLWMWLGQFLSTIGDSCFFFRIPAEEKKQKCLIRMIFFKVSSQLFQCPSMCLDAYLCKDGRSG